MSPVASLAVFVILALLNQGVLVQAQSAVTRQRWGVGDLAPSAHAALLPIGAQLTTAYAFGFRANPTITRTEALELRPASTLCAGLR